MRVLRSVLLVPLLLLWTLSARAQPGGGGVQAEPQTRAEILEQARERKSEQLEPYRISDAERRVRFLETWRLPRRLFTKGFGGVRPAIGGMPSGQDSSGAVATSLGTTASFSSSRRTRGTQPSDSPPMTLVC